MKSTSSDTNNYIIQKYTQVQPLMAAQYNENGYFRIS